MNSLFRWIHLQQGFLDLCKQHLLLSSFSDYKEYHTDVTVKFILSMTEDKLAEAEQAGLHKKFKLESTISTNNMVSYLGNNTVYCDNVILTKKIDHFSLHCLLPHFGPCDDTLASFSLKFSNSRMYVNEQFLDG